MNDRNRLRPAILFALATTLSSTLGFAQAGSIAGVVFADANCDTDRAGDTGIDGATVELFTAGVDMILGTADDVVAASVDTSGGGTYDFTGLAAGRYRVDVDETSVPLVGLLPSGLDRADVTLAAGQSVTDVDIGFGDCPAQPPVCGDCDGSGSGPDAVDALTAATMSALLVGPSAEQQVSCDVDGSGQIDVRDALMMAQRDAGFVVAFACP